MEETEIKGKSHLLLNIFIILVVLLIGVYLYARYVEHDKLIMKEYKIENKKIPQNFSGAKIVHVSDLYFGNTTNIKNVENLVENINKMNPDLILFTGNFYGNNIKRQEELIKSLSKLKSNLGKYAVKGKNDYFENYDSFIESIGFNILENNYELIYKDSLTPIFLCGLNSSLKEEISLDLCIDYFKENENNDYYKIYMIHESDNIKKISDAANPDLILTGNSLGGYIQIPFYGPLLKPKGSKKYINDYYKIGNTDAFVSTGIGTDKYTYRFLNKPSFNLYRLKSLK